MAYAGLRFGEGRELQWDDLLWDPRERADST
jgi:hypothetical protein